jgi:general secretion pathway protein F
MKTYEYKGFDGDGRARKGLVEALSVKNARELLAAEGILAERVAVTGRRVAFRIGMRATVYRELGSLLEAGLPVVRALDTLIQSPELSRSCPLLAGVRDRVKEGAGLADALAGASGSVSAFETAILRAAERTATVPAMLEHLADFLEEQERLAHRLHTALIYPSIVVGTGICVAVLMLGLLVPRARDIMEGSRASLPGVTMFMIGLGRWLFRWGLVVAVALVLGVLAVRAKLRLDPGFREAWCRWAYRVPVWGRGRELLANLRFSGTLSILLRGGVPVVEAVALAGQSTGDSWVARRAAEEAENIRHGTRLSDAVRAIRPLASSLPGWIETGEAGGDLDRLLQRASQRYSDQWNRYVGRCLGILEPALILLIGGFVLLVTLAILLPILRLSKGLG